MKKSIKEITRIDIYNSLYKKEKFIKDLNSYTRLALTDYMKDFISVVKYYILNENPPKIYDCVYSETKTLLEIANIINSLDSHSVEINVGDAQSENYTGNFVSLGLEYVGLESSIRDVYQELKSHNNSQLKQ